MAATRLADLGRKTLGLLDISKPGGAALLDALEALFPASVTVRRFVKPSFGRPAPEELIARVAAACDGVVLALAD